MRKLIVLVAITFLLSGCTVAHFYFVRNLSEGPVTLSFVFADGEGVVLPDSMFIPSSATSHLVNKNTYEYMKDSLVVKRITLKKMQCILPAGGMIMLDKIALKKLQYHLPERMDIKKTEQSDAIAVYFEPRPLATAFKEKGSMPHLHWYDIY